MEANNDKTVLMQAVSAYQLLELLVYRKIYIFDKETILFIPPWLEDKIADKEELSRQFNKVVIFKHGFNFKDNPEKQINEYFECLLRQENIELENISDIHVAGAQYGLGCYLCLNDISFALWEEAAGIISHPDNVRNIDRDISLERMYFCDSLGLYDGKNKNIKRIYANLNCQECEDDPRIENFDVINEMEKLSGEELRQIMSVFTDADYINIPGNAVLLLTEHFANCKRLSFEEHVLIYQLFFDYFLENETVVIKPHPDDLMYYDQLFPNVTIVKEKFPSEFMPYIFLNKPKMLATISSAAVKVMKGKFSEILTLDNRYEKIFKNTHKYYTALNIACRLTEFNRIGIIGCYEPLIRQLSKKSVNAPKQNNDLNICIIDDLDEMISWKEIIEKLETSQKNEVFIFINSMKRYLFYDIQKLTIWDNIVPVIMNKEKTDIHMSDCYVDESQEIIFIYTKSIEIRKEINNMKFENKLKNTGIILQKQVLDEKDMEIKILEGKLEATEKRLLYYIDLVSEYENK